MFARWRLGSTVMRRRHDGCSMLVDSYLLQVLINIHTCILQCSNACSISRSWCLPNSDCVRMGYHAHSFPLLKQ